MLRLGIKGVESQNRLRQDYFPTARKLLGRDMKVIELEVEMELLDYRCRRSDIPYP